MDTVVEVWANTGEVIERPMTPAEKQQRAVDEAAAQAVADAAEQARLEAETKREVALEKLAALGLTRDDLTALGL